MKEEIGLTDLHKAILRRTLIARTLKKDDLYAVLHEEGVKYTYEDLIDAIEELHFYRKYTKLRKLPGNRVTINEKHKETVLKILEEGKFIWEGKKPKPLTPPEKPKIKRKSKSQVLKEIREDVEKQTGRIIRLHEYPPTSKGVKTIEQRDEQLINALENHPDQNLIRNQGFEWKHIYNKKINGEENPLRSGPYAITLHQSDTASALNSLIKKGILTTEGSVSKGKSKYYFMGRK